VASPAAARLEPAPEAVKILRKMPEHAALQIAREKNGVAIGQMGGKSRDARRNNAAADPSPRGKATPSELSEASVVISMASVRSI